ncbi:MAG: sigma-70 family RNA polymerase sigma factor [Actinobacteria bacterium]|nr:sigma-70 family RNA polymerase sigma factor [Actinomycetota bacterium]
MHGDDDQLPSPSRDPHVAAALDWLASDDARAAARRLVRSHSLGLEADDLLSETAVKVIGGLSRRSEPLAGEEVARTAVRYAARSLTNCALDHARKRARSERLQIELASSLPQRASEQERVEGTIFVEQMVASLNAVARGGLPCPGCHREVAFAAATEVLQLALIEGTSTDGLTMGEDWFDDVVSRVIDRVSRGASQLAAARRKRLARCRACVTELLMESLRRMGYRRG